MLYITLRPEVRIALVIADRARLHGGIVGKADLNKGVQAFIRQGRDLHLEWATT